MKYFLFSELVKHSRVKPDPFITNGIDEISFPLKHINFIKHDINNFMFQSFDDIVKTQKNILNSENDVYNEFNTSKKITIEINKEIFEITATKNKKECSPLRIVDKTNFDNGILDNEFIDIINKHYIYISLVCALSFDETYEFIKNNKDKIQLNQRFVYDELLSFWTNSFKNDFCYFNNNESLNFEEREIEFCLIQFYFNYYKKLLLDISEYSGDKYSVLKTIIEDRSSYKWYLIFGFAIWKKIKNKFKNPDDTNYEGLIRFKKLKYNVMHKIFNDMLNQ